MASLPIAAVGVHCDGCLPVFERAVFPARSHGLARVARASPPVARWCVDVQAGPFSILP